MKKARFSIAAALMLSSFSATGNANAGGWFYHSVDEIRSYHTDWLNVCHPNGDGKCRMVQAPVDPERPFFGERRLSVHRQSDGTYRIDIYQSNMPDVPQRPTIRIDRAIFELAPNQWTSGEHAYKNVAETITITDPELTETLLMVMRRGVHFTFSYGETDINRKEAQFLLGGFTSASRAIERLVKDRDK